MIGMDDDPFDALGIAPRFDLDAGEVRRAHLSRVAALHPDVARGDPEAAARSAALNEARARLEDPERRAAALLARFGDSGKDRDKSLPEGFLQEVMAVRMEIECGARDPESIARWRRWAEEERARHIAKVQDMFGSSGAAPAPAVLVCIRRELNAWRYIERLIEQIEPAYGPTPENRHRP